jgi:hypothetical protein
MQLTRGHTNRELLQLAKQLGDQEYIVRELSWYESNMNSGAFKIYNLNHYWLFNWDYHSNLWWCVAENLPIGNPDHKRYRDEPE